MVQFLDINWKFLIKNMSALNWTDANILFYVALLVVRVQRCHIVREREPDTLWQLVANLSTLVYCTSQTPNPLVSGQTGI